MGALADAARHACRLLACCTERACKIQPCLPAVCITRATHAPSRLSAQFKCIQSAIVDHDATFPTAFPGTSHYSASSCLLPVRAACLRLHHATHHEPPPLDSLNRSLNHSSRGRSRAALTAAVAPSQHLACRLPPSAMLIRKCSTNTGCCQKHPCRFRPRVISGAQRPAECRRPPMATVGAIHQQNSCMHVQSQLQPSNVMLLAACLHRQTARCRLACLHRIASSHVHMPVARIQAQLQHPADHPGGKPA